MNKNNVVILCIGIIFYPLHSMDKEKYIDQSKSTQSVIEQLKQSFSTIKSGKYSQSNIKEFIEILKQDPQGSLVKDAASILLHSIIKNTNLGIPYIQDLLKLGADADFKETMKSPSTFVLAVQNNNIEAAQLMLNDTNANSEVLPKLPLLDYVACNPELNHFAIQLIYYGAHIEPTKSYNAPIYRALEGNNPNLAQFLMARGARLNCGIYESQIATTILQDCDLLCCFLKTHRDQKRFSHQLWELMNNAIRLDLADAVETLYYFARQEQYKEDDDLSFIVQQALQHNAQKSAAFLISQLNDPSIIQELLKITIENPSIVISLAKRYFALTNKSLSYALNAIKNNQTSLIQAIVEHDKTFDLIEQDKEEHETLLITALKNSSEMALLLLNHIKARAHKNMLSYLNKKNFYEKNTALHFAVKHKNISAVKQLLALGADDTVTNEFDATPAHFAQIVGNIELIRIFQDHAYHRREQFLSND